MKTLSTFPLLLCLSAALVTTACQTQTPAFNMPALSVQSQQMMQHLYALEDIANQHQGHRAVGSQGGQATAAYIIRTSQALGFQAEQVPFANVKGVAGQHIFVEVKGKNEQKVVMLGAHYDSVERGPGINDNGSGVAVLLSLLAHYQQHPPQDSLMFVFWDSEEQGLASKDYVKKLQAQQLAMIKAYINVDMVGTRSPTAMVVDGDRSSLDDMEKTFRMRGVAPKDYRPVIETLRATPAHVGDAALEASLKQFYQSKKVKYKEDVAILNASDTLGFLGKVPVASIILFNEQVKGTVLEFAPCYHQACDTVKHIDPKSLQLAAQAVQYLIDDLAQR
jgi:aminopeptidase S